MRWRQRIIIVSGKCGWCLLVVCLADDARPIFRRRWLVRTSHQRTQELPVALRTWLFGVLPAGHVWHYFSTGLKEAGRPLRFWSRLVAWCLDSVFQLRWGFQVYEDFGNALCLWLATIGSISCLGVMEHLGHTVINLLCTAVRLGLRKWRMRIMKISWQLEAVRLYYATCHWLLQHIETPVKCHRVLLFKHHLWVLFIVYVLLTHGFRCLCSLE